MTSAIQEYWRRNHKIRDLSSRDTYTNCPRLACADGFGMSVQASSSHYSTPRYYAPDGSYSAWEVGFPTARDELLMPFVEDASDPTETVYGYVPTEIIDRVIEAHGGLVAPSEEAA